MSKVRDFLGPYRLARLIRLGSVCQVWEAIEESTNERVALKVLRPEQRGNKEELNFLKWEYEVGSKLHHKNIIRISDFYTKADTPFLVLELFSELNAKMAMRRGPESIAFMVDKIFLQTAESLYYLHSKGFIHCDVKPDNVLVDRTGEVKLIDFTIAHKKRTGISKLFGGKPKLRGTRSYMSPEQIRQEHLDERSDVYSLGCMFYEMLTGKLPFTATSPNDLLSKHLSAPIPSALVQNSNVSNDFNGVLKAMMAKDPKDRPSSMYEVVKAVKGVKIFNRPPRLPEKSIFDDLPMGGRVENREQASGNSKPAEGAPKPEAEKPSEGDKTPETPKSAEAKKDDKKPNPKDQK
jgi:serine/threonine protein kinase